MILRLTVVTAVVAVVATLTVGPSATAAEQRPAPTDGPVAVARIEGDRDATSWLVTFEDGTSSARVQTAVTAARTLGGTVGRQWRHAVVGFQVDAGRAVVEQVAALPGVALVEADDPITVTSVQAPATWGLDRIDQRDLPLDDRYAADQDGRRVRAYVIDTGILADHTEFGDRVLVEEGTAVDDGRGTTDCNGHGTHVAGTIGGATHGVAQQVWLVPYRALDCDGSGSEAQLVGALEFLARDARLPAVANMSLSGPRSSTVDAAAQAVIDAGVTLVVASGNTADDACRYSPSRLADAITVGATDAADDHVPYSNDGPCVDVLAPGDQITSAWPSSTTAMRSISGTSMAAAHAAGVAALALAADPAATPVEVTQLLTSTATPDRIFGEGSDTPDLLLHAARDASDLCTADEPVSGRLDGTGDRAVATRNFVLHRGDDTRACLKGAEGTDFDLVLQRRTSGGGSWADVRTSADHGSIEQLAHTATADGTHRWVVASSAGAGSFQLQWLATPATNLAPIGTSTDGSVTLRLSSSEADVRFECRLDGGARRACHDGQQLSGLAEGSHTLQARAVDRHGNVDPSPASRRFTVEFPPGGHELFVDVVADDEFTRDIGRLAAAGVTRGCNPPDNTRFCPDDPVTRGQMAAFLDRAFGLADGSRTFADTRGHVFEANIAALHRAGITSGCNDAQTRFCPDDPVTRGQMAAFLDRALGLAGGSRTFVDTRGHLFEANIAALAEAGITKGCNPAGGNTRFCPDEPVTRGQMAAFLDRAGLLS